MNLLVPTQRHRSPYVPLNLYRCHVPKDLPSWVQDRRLGSEGKGQHAFELREVGFNLYWLFAGQSPEESECGARG